MIAANAGDLRAVQRLLAVGASVHVRSSPQGDTALALAVCTDNTECTRLLLCAGAHCDAGDALSTAACNDSRLCLRMLLVAGACVDKVGECNSHKTAQAKAIDNNNFDCVTLILNAGASVGLARDAVDAAFRAASETLLEINNILQRTIDQCHALWLTSAT